MYPDPVLWRCDHGSSAKWKIWVIATGWYSQMCSRPRGTMQNESMIIMTFWCKHYLSWIWVCFGFYPTVCAMYICCHQMISFYLLYISVDTWYIPFCCQHIEYFSTHSTIFSAEISTKILKLMKMDHFNYSFFEQIQ